MNARVVSRGALAGAAAALAWAGAEPIASRLLKSPYSDVRLLGRMVVRRGAGWRIAGLTMHVANGALFGAAFAPLVALGLSARFGLVAVTVYLLSGCVCTLLALRANRALAARD